MAIDHSVIVDAFYTAAAHEFAALNSDGFWESFRVEHNALLFRIEAHRTKDPAYKGTFEQFADIGEFISVVAEDGYFAFAEAHAYNAAHALNAYRDADWDESLKQRQEQSARSMAWEEE